MKVLHSADWHLDGKNPYKEEGTKHCLEWMLEKAPTLSPDVILISGDIFDKAKVWIERGAKEISYTYRIIKQLSEIAPVVAIKGTPNHDGKEQFEMLADMLPEQSNIHLLTKPEIVHIETKNGPANIIGIPGIQYGSYRAAHAGLSKSEENQLLTDDIMSIIRNLRLSCKREEKNILMAHYTTTGCNTESGQVMMFAENEVVLPRHELQELAFDLIALGHIHRPQQVAEGIYYAGGINAFNFGDEGQKRGFYLHDLEQKKAEFIQTPHQVYKTLRFSNDEVEKFNAGDYSPIREDIAGCIVRVYYEATQEQLNQLSCSAMEEELMKQGAIWVNEITCDKCIEVQKSTTMGSDPIENIIAYLKDEADIEQIEAIARPVFEDDETKHNKPKGRMVPLSISVKNYRNYREESFDFSDIIFATVSGPNGAGKSSFFMDAIMDCIYEDTRENDLKGWISNHPDAKSGSISFIFSIGNDVYRIVRTRTKSGKCTLSLCQYVDDEWINQSGEKIKETQERITALIGDPLTLKSCGLIMQDEYGLFLEVDRTDRMRVLAGLLDLDVYEKAKESFSEMALDKKRDLAFNTKVRDQLIEKLNKEESLESEIISVSERLTAAEAKKKQLELEKEQLQTVSKIKDQIKSLEDDRKKMENSQFGLSDQVKELEQQIELINTELSQEQDIRNHADQARTINQQLKSFDIYDEQMKAALTEKSGLIKQQTEIESEIKQHKLQFNELVQKISRREALKVEVDNYTDTQKTLETLLKNGEIRESLIMDYNQKKSVYSLKKQAYETEYASRIEKYRVVKENHRLVQISGCKGSVPCPFIEKAMKEGANLADQLNENKQWKQNELSNLSKLESEVESKKLEIEKYPHDLKQISDLNEKMQICQEAMKEYSRLTAYDEQKIDLKKRIANESEKVASIKQRLYAINETMTQLESQISQREKLMSALHELEIFIDLEKTLDSKKQLRTFKQETLSEKCEQLMAIEKSIRELGEEEIKLSTQLEAFPDARNIMAVEMEAETLNKELRELYISEAQLKVRQEEKQKTESEQLTVLETLKLLSQQLTQLNLLKEACSYTGIPHLIISDEIRTIENKANAILSQMSQGQMSVTFATEKLVKSNGGKEIPVLDVFINDEVTGTLSYKSRSGGERVKVSLASALALAELKASKTGIQLGFLFIDEPPFLDDNGMESYCDALEAISHRYAGLKVIAISHDGSMQARFLQTIQVVKTPNGSQILK